jgi:hypothetical protein
MAFTHPEIDALVASHKLHGEAIALLRRKTPSAADRERKVTHPLLQHVTDEAATLELLINRKEELQAELAEKVPALRKAAADDAMLVEMAKGETAYADMTDKDLADAITNARSAAESHANCLRVLLLEARRRRGLVRAKQEVAKLSPQARELLKQTLAAGGVPATTTVRG